MAIFALNKDVVQWILMEWLTWKDISQWDIACLGSSRKEWLAHLSEFTWERDDPFTQQVPDRDMALCFYKWLLQRLFFTRRFPLELSLVDYLFCCLGEDDRFLQEVTSLTIHGVDLPPPPSPMSSHSPQEWIDRLGSLLKRCSRLEEIVYNELSPRNHELLCMLMDRCPSLRKIELNHVQLSTCSSTAFLSNHVSALEELTLHGSKCSPSDLLGFLRQHDCCLRELHLTAFEAAPLAQSDLIDYVSACGRHLKCLCIAGLPLHWTVTEELVTTLLSCCPALEVLALRHNFMRTKVLSPLFSLFLSFPRLRTLRLVDFVIDIEEEKKRVLLCLVRVDEEGLKDWLIPALQLLQRGYTLRIVSNAIRSVQLKAIASNFHSFLESFAGMVSHFNDNLLKSLLRQCPHLIDLSIMLDDDSDVSDEALEAIVEYKPALKVLIIETMWTYPVPPLSDRAISAMINSCKSLVKLVIPFAGCASIQAAADLPLLRELRFESMEAEEDEVVDLLSRSTIQWPQQLACASFHLASDDSRLDLCSDRSMVDFRKNTIHELRKCNGSPIFLAVPKKESFPKGLR